MTCGGNKGSNDSRVLKRKRRKTEIFHFVHKYPDGYLCIFDKYDSKNGMISKKKTKIKTKKGKNIQLEFLIIGLSK